jgi:hypothetical protein
MAAINETRRRSPQFRRACIDVTHSWRSASACIFRQIAFSANLAIRKTCLILTRVSRFHYAVAGAAGAFVGRDDMPSVRRGFLKKLAFAGVNSAGNRDELRS